MSKKACIDKRELCTGGDLHELFPWIFVNRNRCVAYIFLNKNAFTGTFLWISGTLYLPAFFCVNLYMLPSRPINLLAHAIGWLLFAILIGGFTVSGSGSKDFTELLVMPSFYFFLLTYFVLFYSNSLYLFPLFYLKKKYGLYFSVIIALAVLVFFLQPFDRLLSDAHRGNEELTNRPFTGRSERMEPSPYRMDGDTMRNGNPPPERDKRPPPDGMPNDRGRPPDRGGAGSGPSVDIVSIVLFIMVWSFSSGVKIFKQWRATEKRALQAEADKANAELSFLRAQINPHFLFNTLNNIYSLVVTKSDGGPQAIMKLSQMLRYVTDEATQDFVPLEAELQCIGNYIDLQHLRLSKNVSVNFSVIGITEGKTIPPLIFMTFVENVFKYGISSHDKTDIAINISASENGIHFHCRNKIFHQPLEGERKGIGIDNAKKRLRFLYPQKHELSIHQQDGFFTVTLDITS